MPCADIDSGDCGAAVREGRGRHRGAADPSPGALITPVQPEGPQANLLVAASLNPSEKKIYDLLQSDEPQPIDDIVERSGLNSSEVLATLFDLEMKGIVRQLPGKLFSKILP
ncbi:MAG TPA: winged helix-turn-helix transcriptional regulator [Candidatus Acidoferrum sp.]|nr:winged helix-turn-helix transcriptional regulator [Candidatus Acidoferrum sp.]